MPKTYKAGFETIKPSGLDKTHIFLLYIKQITIWGILNALHVSVVKGIIAIS